MEKPQSSKVASRSNLMEEPTKRHDHAMDALRYGVMTLPKTEEEMEEEIRKKLEGILPVVQTAQQVFEKDDTFQEEEKEYYDEHLGLI